MKGGLIFVMMDPWAYSVALAIGPCTLTRTLHCGNLAPWFEVHCCKNMPDLNLLVMFLVMALILYYKTKRRLARSPLMCAKRHCAVTNRQIVFTF